MYYNTITYYTLSFCFTMTLHPNLLAVSINALYIFYHTPCLVSEGKGKPPGGNLFHTVLYVQIILR
jgi:hypothetical protein